MRPYPTKSVGKICFADSCTSIRRGKALSSLVSLQAKWQKKRSHPRNLSKPSTICQWNRAEILAGLKPAFVHHPECKRLIPKLLRELGCDLDLLRCTAAANFRQQQFSKHRHFLRFPSAPRYLVFRATVSTQLVDSGFRCYSGKRNGLPSPLLERSGAQ